MAASEGAFHLTFVQGRGLLSLSDRDFEGLGHVDSLELDIPNLRFPFDLSGGVARFKNRRLSLRELSLFVAAGDIATVLSRAPLDAFGIFEPRVVIDGQRLTLRARVALGGHEAEVTALAALSPLPPRSASLCVYDACAYGFLPVPAPLVVTALFSALGAESPAKREGEVELPLAPLLQIRTASEIRVDVCELAMLAILPMHGWRLPDRGHVRIRAAGGAADARRIPLLFSHGDAGDPPLGEEELPAVQAMRAFAARSSLTEEALARADVATALAQLRALAPLEAEDKVGTCRLLQILGADAETLDEAGHLAHAALSRWPTFAPAVLTLAVLAGARGAAAEAGACYERLAELWEAQGREVDQACALLAAARHYARASEPERALSTLERSLGHRRGLRPASRARIAALARDGAWDEILAELGQQAGREGRDGSDEVARALELFHQGSLTKDDTLIARAAEVLEDLLGRADWRQTSLSRGEAAYQLGAIRLVLGDDAGASRWLAACIEGDAPAPVAAAAWRALAELMHRRGDAGREVQALLGWAGDPRIHEKPEEKVRHLLAAADIALYTLKQPAEAAGYLDMALGLAPAHGKVLAALEGVATVMRDPVAVAEILRRRLRESRPEQGQAILRVLIRLLAESDAHADDVKDACAVLLELSPGDEEARFFQARSAWKRGERRTAAQGYLASTNATSLAPAQLAEAELRTAEVLLAEGDERGASLHRERALAHEPRGAPLAVLSQSLRALGHHDQLPALLAARQASASDPGTELEVKRCLAALAEDSGDLEAARTIYRGLHEAFPSQVEWLERLAALCRRQARPSELRGWLERTWALIERDNLSAADRRAAESAGLELAELLAADTEGKARAQAIVNRLAATEPPSTRVLDLGYQLALDRGAFDEAQAAFARRLALNGDEGRAAFVVSRVRACMAQANGQRPALAMVQSLALDQLDDEGLRLRAELAQAADDVADAAACLDQLRRGVPESERAALTQRLADLAARPATAGRMPVSVLEKLQLELPDSLLVAKALFEAHGQSEDVAARNQAWQSLLYKVPALPDSYRARLQTSMAEAAEQEGNLVTAHELLDTAGRLDSTPRARVSQLVARARVWLAQGEGGSAEEALKEALSLNPDAPAALALTAELRYGVQDWEGARRAYARLAQLGAAGVPPKLLASRRAELAELFGDQAEAEAAYRDALALDGQDPAARDALAGFALARGDFAEAALHLRELVSILPKEAVDRLTHARQRLGQAALGLGDLPTARHYLELALASDPDRASTLDLLATTYEKVGLFREAAASCERLSRVLTDVTQKAAALFREGEILRACLGDGEGALEAYLRGSDLDPGFAPNLARLVAHYWSRGDLASLADVGADLVKAGPSPELDRPDLGLLVAAAALLARGDERLAEAALASPFVGGPLHAELAAARLAELVPRLPDPSALDRLLGLLSSRAKGFAGDLCDAARRRASSDPGNGAAWLVLGRLFERERQPVLARSAYSVAHFLDPGLGAAGPLGVLGYESKARPQALLLGSPAVHPSARGGLRALMQHLAVALVAPAPSPEVGVGPLLPATAALCADLERELALRGVAFVSYGDGLDVTLSATGPLRVLVGRRAESLPAEELRFLVARAVEQARAGTLALLRMSQDNLHRLLQALVGAAGRGVPVEAETAGPDESSASWLERLREAEAAGRLPLTRVAAALADLAEQLLAQPPDLDAYIRGCRYTADRIGLLAAGKPLSALRGWASAQKDGIPVDDATVEQRQELLRSSQGVRELLAFMVSEDYAALVAAP